MADIIKKTINRILSLFPIPKIHPKLYDMEKEAEQIALLGEINTESIKPMSEPPEWIIECVKESLNEAKGKEIIMYIDGKEVKRGVYNG